MPERDLIFGFCVGCPRALELLGTENKGPSSERLTAIRTTILWALGEHAVTKCPDGPQPDIVNNEPKMVCGQLVGILSVEDVMRLEEGPDKE